MGCPETACSCFLPVVPICPSRLLNLQKGGHPLYAACTVCTRTCTTKRFNVPRWAVTYHQRRCSVWSWSSLGGGSVMGITKGGNKIRRKDGSRAKASCIQPFSQLEEKGVLPSYVNVLRIPSPWRRILSRIRSPPPISHISSP